MNARSIPSSIELSSNKITAYANRLDILLLERQFIENRLPMLSIEIRAEVLEATRAIHSGVPTPTERKVLHGIRMGKGTKEIAADLHIAVGTVKFHVSNLLRRYGVDSRDKL